LGIKVGKFVEDRGNLVGAMVVEEDDEVLVVMNSGNVVRSPVSGVPPRGRDTMGVIFAKPRKNDRILKVAKSSGAALAAAGEEPGEPEGPEDAPADNEAATSEAQVQYSESSE
jgi:DNA gyrase subunit A